MSNLIGDLIREKRWCVADGACLYENGCSSIGQSANGLDADTRIATRYDASFPERSIFSMISAASGFRPMPVSMAVCWLEMLMDGISSIERSVSVAWSMAAGYYDIKE